MRIRYFGSARAAAGVAEEQIRNAPITLTDLTRRLAQCHPTCTVAGTPFAKILDSCTFLLDGVPISGSDTLVGGQCLDVLPPFAGG